MLQLLKLTINCDSSKLDKRRLKAKGEGISVMVTYILTGNLLQASIALKKEVIRNSEKGNDVRTVK